MIFYIMLTGFNTNIKYKGEVFHIQTEDSGLRNPVITTLLYRGGVILASKKTNYRELIPDDTTSISTILREKIKELMNVQHRSMISELLAGRFDEIIAGHKPPLQETRIISEVESPVKKESMKALNSEKGDVTTAEESKIEGPRTGSGLEKQNSQTKHHSMRSLDDILLDHILKRKKV